MTGYVHPFNEGYDARLEGKDEYDCPYPADDWRHNAWQHGWEEADDNSAMEVRDAP